MTGDRSGCYSPLIRVLCRSMWTYLEGSFLDGIYNEVWYNDGDSQ